MAGGKLNIYKRVRLEKPRVLLGFSGWMDSGEVSTGVVKQLVKRLGAEKIGEIEAEGFYIQSFPGSMEITAMFRPYTKINEGLITSFEMPRNEFFCSEEHNLILFSGREPNLNWREFAECIFRLCSEFGVEMIYFIGSVAGLVPHTREPRILCSVSDGKVKEVFAEYGLKFTNYEGPASIVTYLSANANKHGVGMASLVAAVPAYIQGNNPKCIESVTRVVAGILGVHIELDAMRNVSDAFEKKLNDVIERQPELAENIQKLEENYDNEIFDEEMGDLKEWLEQKGVRLD